jgi:hypothetical protein
LLIDARGRIWFGLFAHVCKCPFCAQIAAFSSALVRDSLLTIVGFTGKMGSPFDIDTERGYRIQDAASIVCICSLMFSLA